MSKPITSVWASGNVVVINVPSPTGGVTDSYNFTCEFNTEEAVSRFVHSFREKHDIPTY